jgi:hypothetical protein
MTPFHKDILIWIFRVGVFMNCRNKFQWIVKNPNVYNLLWNEPNRPFPTQENGGPGKVACHSIRWLWVFPWPIPKCNFVVSIMFSIVTDHIKKE